MIILVRKLFFLLIIHVSAKEEEGKIIFLHKVKNGAVDKSYGIHVASLVGLPKEIIKRSSEILNVYEKNEGKREVYTQTSLFLDFDDKESKLEKRLKEIDPLQITPLEALNLLASLKEDAINKDKLKESE